MIEETLKEILTTLKSIDESLASNANGGKAAPEPEEDLGGETEPAVTQADVLEAVKAAAGRNREKTIAVLAKFNAKKAVDVAEADRAKAVEALGKVK